MRVNIPSTAFPAHSDIFFDRRAIPAAEELLDELCEALLCVNWALEVTQREGVQPRIAAQRARLQTIYDDVNAILIELSD